MLYLLKFNFTPYSSPKPTFHIWFGLRWCNIIWHLVQIHCCEICCYPMWARVTQKQYWQIVKSYILHPPRIRVNESNKISRNSCFVNTKGTIWYLLKGVQYNTKGPIMHTVMLHVNEILWVNLLSSFYGNFENHFSL